MNKQEAKKIIKWWFNLPQRFKDRNWDKVYPLMNKYPDIYEETRKERLKNVKKTKYEHRKEIKHSDDVVKWKFISLF